MTSDNRGSATVEATLILPLFIFCILVFFHGLRLLMAEAILYEAAAETVEYMAQVSYLEECSYVVPLSRLGSYIDNPDLIEDYIVGGLDGVSFHGSEYLNKDGYVCLSINYKVSLNLPIIGDFTGDRSYEIRQKAYVGDEVRADGDELSSDEVYVYITDNREAYHTTRACTHLDLSITAQSLVKAKKEGYTCCEYCGEATGNSVLVTNYGNKYHSHGDCVGLKRTVYRVKKTQVEGLGACERCGG